MNRREREEIGFMALRSGDYQEALNLFKDLWHRDKRHARAYLGYGLANFHLEDYETARWAFYKAIEIDPTLREAEEHLRRMETMKKTDYPPFRRPEVIKMKFKVGEDYLEVLQDEGWKRLFIKGINIGIGIAGHYPGEFYIKKGTYKKWFKQIGDLGINTIRIYTVHPPWFYEALYEHNLTSDKKLYLIQGIWVELPPDGRFDGERYEAEVVRGIREAVDAIFGTANIPERPGRAHGLYRVDVSDHTMAFLFGREWESCPVLRYNQERDPEDFHGRCLSIERGRPMEVWLTRMCNTLQTYELERYRYSHPVSTINWPTLDPLDHPAESRHQDELLWQGIHVDKGRCMENEDEEHIDLSRVKVSEGAGLFAAYHVYPYYPDFMNNDYRDSDKPYSTYLRKLKEYHKGQPVLIAEFGVPTSREIAHWHGKGWHHGGHEERQKGNIDGTMIEDIYNARMAGGILFSWFDEWYKKNWLFSPYEMPEDRRAFWYNFQNAEQNYGLLSLYPNYPEKKVYLDGDLSRWKKATLLYKSERESPLYRFEDGMDDGRKLNRFLVTHDEGFLYLLLKTKGEIQFDGCHYVIGLFIQKYFRSRLPFRLDLDAAGGFNFLIHIAGRKTSRILISSSYDRYLRSGGTYPADPGGDSKYLVEPGDGWVMMFNKVNNRRISRDRNRYYPTRVMNMSPLRFGSLDRKSPDYHTLADFYVKGNVIELRIPWGLIYISDPSSRSYLTYDEKGDIVSGKTEGIGLLALSYKPDRSGRFSAMKTGGRHNATDILPADLSAIKTYRWEEWDFPAYHTYLKDSYYIYRDSLWRVPELIEQVR